MRRSHPERSAKSLRNKPPLVCAMSVQRLNPYPRWWTVRNILGVAHKNLCRFENDIDFYNTFTRESPPPTSRQP